MLIFIDFDGVTHPFFPRYDLGEKEIPFFIFLPKIESVVSEFDEARFVISSSWRLSHTLDQLRQYFSEKMRHRVIGMSPEITLRSDEDWTGCRQREAELYLKQHQMEGTPWVALDDVKENYDPDVNFIHCLDKFEEVEATQLRKILSSMRAQ